MIGLNTGKQLFWREPNSLLGEMVPNIHSMVQGHWPKFEVGMFWPVNGHVDNQCMGPGDSSLNGVFGYPIINLTEMALQKDDLDPRSRVFMDQYEFNFQGFLEDCFRKNQSIDFCGLGTHQQNGVAKFVM